MSTMPARRSIRSPARSHLRLPRERLARTSVEIPRRALYPGDYLKPVGVLLAAEHGDEYRRRARGRMAADFPRRRRSRRCSTSSATILACSASTTTCSRPRREVQRIGRGRAGDGGAARQGPGLPGRAGAAQEPRRARRVGAGRADPVPLDPVRRRPGPADEEIGRQLDLFRRRCGLPLAKGAAGRSSGQHLGRGPCRHGQARPGGGEGADRRPDRPRRQAHPDGAAVPRRRAGEDVQARRRLRHACARWSRRSARTSCGSSC